MTNKEKREANRQKNIIIRQKKVVDRKLDGKKIPRKCVICHSNNSLIQEDAIEDKKNFEVKKCMNQNLIQIPCIW